MSNNGVQNWLERVLVALLPSRDRETITGDLYEEFTHRRTRRGAAAANAWYAWQVLSFLPRQAVSAVAHGPVLALVCIFTGLSGLWLGIMDLRLKHPGYAGREVIAATVVFQALVTLAAVYVRRLPHLRWVALVGCVSITWLSGNAIFYTLHGAHPEGYVLLIALALIVQVMLTCMNFLKQPQIKAKRNT